MIYAGLLGLGLGVSVHRGDAVLGWGIAAAGAIAVVAGVVLIWVRSRLESIPETVMETT